MRIEIHLCISFRYGITLTITVASIMLSRLPEKIVIVIMGIIYANDLIENNTPLEPDTIQFNCGNNNQIQDNASNDVIFYPNETTQGSNVHTQGNFEESEFFGWAGQWIMRLPFFILSLINPWIYAYHNVDFKRCMNRYIRKILVGWKLIGQEAKSNAGIFATVKLDKSYMTTAQIAGSNAGKAVFCSIHYLSAVGTHGQPNVNANVGTNGVCTCIGVQNNTLSPPPSPSPSSGYMKNIAFHMSSQRLNNIQNSMSR